MPIVFADRVKVRTRTNGTGTLTLENTVDGFQSFAAVGNGNQTYYGIEHPNGTWEIGLGTYSSTGPSLTRDSVLSSSNAGALVNFDGGSKTVFVTIPSSVAANIIASTTFAFRDIAVAGQTTVEADSTTDTLTLVAGANIDITTNAGTDTITIANNLSAVASNILPNVNSNGTTGFTLGSPSFKWKELFVSNGSIYIGDVKLSNVGGKLAVTKVINPGEETEAEDPDDSDAGSEIGGGNSVAGLTGNTDYTPDSEGDVRYELSINGDIELRTYQSAPEGPGNDLGPGISLGNTSSPIRSGAISIGNSDVGYNAKQGGVYIGYQAGWNNDEDPQGEYAIAIGARAARNFAQDNSITLNATGENLDPTADGLYIKPVREDVGNIAKAVYYNTTTGEMTYADSTGGVTGDSNIWVQTFETQDGAPTDIVGIATSVEYDAAGNVIALFSHFNDNDNSTYYSVGKYTTAGAKLWTARFADDFYTDGWGLAVDNDSNAIYVAGKTAPDSGYSVSTLTKLDGSDGSIIWSKTYDFGYDSQSAVVDVASDGSPVMVGYAYNNNDDYVTTTKVSAVDGSITWTRSLDGQGDEQAYGMAVGPDGEVVVIGYMENIEYEGPVNTILTLSASPASDPDWTVNQTGVTTGGLTFDVSFTDGVASFSNIVDTTGNHFVGEGIGQISGGSLGAGSTNLQFIAATVTAEDLSDRMLVVKYDSTGSIQWQKAIQFDENFNCSGADADIDSMGNIYVTGSYQYSFNSGTTSALSILKLDGNGAKQWSRRVVGNCDTFGTSVVVGPDDKLYLSAVTGNNNDANNAYTWVAAKYGFDGAVEWQRLIDNTTSWTFGGFFFLGNGGGSNIAVKQDYVVLAGGFGFLPGEPSRAAVVQVAATGDVFSVGDWDFKAASFSGVLNGTASDITVANAGKTDTDNSENITTGTVSLGTEVGGFLLGTLYSEAVGNERLVNGANQLVLETYGTVTLPAGGTISEGYVTSNPTIQLAPASPDVASQKLVIKGGGSYNANANGIGLNWYIINPSVNDIVEIYVNSPDNADQTLYWWIYPEGAGIASPESGTVILNNGGSGDFSFTVDSDDYEFTVRVSPEANNYDPASGVETQLFNSSAPTLDVDHHLHLTTGDLTETSIFLGTDNHNVRTTTDGKIQITTPNETNNVWEFGTDGRLTLPQGGDILDSTGTSVLGGTSGLSAYEVAVNNGFPGTEQDWLASLVGADGAEGPQGSAGTNVVLKGTVATVIDLDSIVGPVTGDLYIVLADSNGYVYNGSTWDNVGPIQGPQGEPGPRGADGSNGNDGNDGNDGASAYQLYLNSISPTFVSEQDWLASLFGAPGASGAPGVNGLDGANGADGINGVDGADGADALWFWQGEYNASTVYVEGDIVSYGSFNWRRTNFELGQSNFDPISYGGTTGNVFWYPLASRIVFVAPPATSSGNPGDTLNMLAIDNSYLYYCTADYTTGGVQIWQRIVKDNTSW